MEGPEGRAGLRGGLPGVCPDGYFSVSATQCGAASLDRPSCSWGWRLVSILSADPELSCWGVPPALFSVALSLVLAGDLRLGGTAGSLLWHPWAHGYRPTSPSLFSSFVFSWAPQSGAK